MNFIILLFVPMSALAGYKHLKVALNGQSTVIFSKRRKISSIWTDHCGKLKNRVSSRQVVTRKPGSPLQVCSILWSKNKNKIMPPPGIAPGLPAPQAGVLLLYYSGGCKRLAMIRTAIKNQKQNQKDIQHPRFPCSPLPKYWSGPTMLNFAVRMGCGAFTVVWPYDESAVGSEYTCLKS